MLRGWCDGIVHNVHAPTVDKSDNTKDGFYDEVGRAFHEFSKYHMKTLLGDFNANVRRENTFKPTIGIESLHEISIVMIMGLQL